MAAGAVITMTQVPPAAMAVLHVFEVTVPSPEELIPELEGVTANALGFLNVVLKPVEVTTVNAVIAGVTVNVIGTLGTLPPAEETPVSVPL